ncbi:hypothetical protein [Nocardia brasiliensis]|uniref:hypothetical protein n=1 Tax=Nocardia brasiliensis TaxID=37326 RepID=UPI0024547D7B|nr:hypothetical protein [Nocardia brasiliensis]
MRQFTEGQEWRCASCGRVSVIEWDNDIARFDGVPDTCRAADGEQQLLCADCSLDPC